MSSKTENHGQNIKFEIEEFNTNLKTKCGLIYYNNINEFIYFCIYCEKEFENSILFESHVNDSHIIDSVDNIDEIRQFKQDIKLKTDKDFEKYDDDDTINSMKKFCQKDLISDEEETTFKIEDSIAKQKIHKDFATTNRKFNSQFKLVGPGPFNCEFCCKILKNQHTYRVHINLQHSGLGPFKCNICAHSMKTKLNLDNHIKRVHKNINAPIYKCNFCELGFTSDSKLTLHVHKIHTFEKTFECKVCGKNFMNMGNLKTHEHIHTGIKPFQCEICGKKFIRSNNMDVHKRRHLSDRNIKCKLCNKMFYTRTSMEDHLISHTNEKNFTCEYCNTKFARKGDKLKHIQMKHPEFLSNDKKNKYICNICKADFALRVSFKQHMKSQHSVTLSNLNDSKIPKDY